MNRVSAFIFSLLFMLLMQNLQPLTCQAMDPRFELDPGQVRKESSGVVRAIKKSYRRNHSHRSRKFHHGAIALQKDAAEQGQPSAAFQLASATAAASEPDLQRVRSFWEKVTPSSGAALPPLVFKSDIFDLAIDPVRYPLLKAADGGKLLLDTGGTLPPLVRTLIQEKDPSVRIVTASPSNGRRFLGALLMAGGFYSVEERPVMTFGNDPLLTVRSDFKVERTAESVMRNEVMLVSASHQGVPSHLTDYLKSQGFELLEPFAERMPTPVPLRHRVIRAVPAGQFHSVDLVLDALGVPAERNRRVELFHAAESGIGLSVAAERYFERSGQRYVVARFTGDPITYTLFRLLETKGYRVVILEPQDSFKTVAGKLLSRMELSSSYASHLLVADPSGQYSIEMSGFLLENSSSNGGAVLLTDRPLERSMREILYDQGYQVQER